MSVKGSQKYYLAWASLVDFAFESLLGRLTQKHDPSKAFRELKKILQHQSDQHCQGLYSLLKKIK